MTTVQFVEEGKVMSTQRVEKCNEDNVDARQPLVRISNKYRHIHPPMNAQNRALVSGALYIQYPDTCEISLQVNFRGIVSTVAQNNYSLFTKAKFENSKFELP